ncbi:MAG: ComF family protein [Porticoccus sp.]
MVESPSLSTLLQRYSAAIQRGSYYLFPGRCVLCGALSKRPLDLCEGCDAELPFNQPACQCCALPMTAMGSATINIGTCGQCISNPPDFTRCIAPLRYEFPINKLINGFKHHGQFSRGAVLAELLLRELASQERPPELILPVPLHWRRQFTRGFNQALWLSHYLGRRLTIPVDTRLLYRQKYTPAQQGLPRQQRLKNLKGAFCLNNDVEGKHIALVDDVVTTGSTISELSRLLRKAGAIHVETWCLARTPLEK